MDRATAENIVTHVGWLSRQTKTTRERLLRVAHLSHYEPGEVVYGLDDKAGGIFGLVSGEFDLLIAPMPLPPLLGYIARPGWWTGEAAMITNTPRRGTLTARTSGWLFHIPKSAIERLAADDPRLWRCLAEITVSHLDHALKMVVALSQKDPRTRVLAVLAILANSPLTDQNLSISLTHDELGEMTRLTRSSLRKILRQLHDEGLVQMRYGRLEFPKPNNLNEKLASLADP